MKSNLTPGLVLSSGFEVLAVEELPELDGTGIWARHTSGAEVFHIYTEDEENLFAFGFATAPEDSTGVAHILEHSVLCGSDKYPLKDTFLILSQGSLQTFLNALTFPDKTLYPASSINEQDYFNLMSVYGDAVFHPLLPQWVFLQEGHRIALDAPPGGEATLTRTGVVYNEMKGSYSSRDTYAAFWACSALLPDTPYAHESGGDPDRIPDLTWEGLKDFHQTRYVPANCRIFLAGNIDTERQLAFLNDAILTGLPSGNPAAPISLAAPWSAPDFRIVPCPAGGDPKATVIVSWLCSDICDSMESLALTALSEALLGHDGSPLIRPLIESGLGEDIAPVSGLERDLRQLTFSLGLRGVPGKGEASAREIEAFIMETLERVATEGIPQEEIEAALLSLEFSNREIRRAGGPYSLVWLQRSFRGWLHGAKPWDTLLFVPWFDQLKERLNEDSRYFESLIEKYLLHNPHRILLSMEGEEDFLDKKEAALETELEALRQGMSQDEAVALAAEAQELEEIQKKADAPEALAAIPHLSRKDLSASLESIPREFLNVAGIPALTHDLHTNGISYVTIALPVDVLDPQDYLWLPLFSRTVVSMGLPGLDYGQVSTLLARTAGDLSAFLQTGSQLTGTAQAMPYPGGILDLGGRDWIRYSMKALDDKADDALGIMQRFILESDFTDLRRLQDLVLEMRNEVDSSFVHGALSFASGLANRGANRSRLVDETWSGISQMRFVHALASYPIEAISQKLESIRDRLREAGILANITGSATALSRVTESLAASWRQFGPPKPRNPAALAMAPSEYTPEFADSVEVYGSPSLQIGFAALSLPGSPYNTPEHAAELVLSHQLSTGPLWEDIRMQGGAYGAYATCDGLEELYNFGTYRDPNPFRSQEAFTRILAERAANPMDEDSLEKAIIGSYGRETRPQTPSTKGGADFNRFLYGIDMSHREKRLQALLAVSEADLVSAAGRFAALAQKSPGPGAPPRVIFAGTAVAQEAAARLGVECRNLPV